MLATTIIIVNIIVTHLYPITINDIIMVIHLSPITTNGIIVATHLSPITINVVVMVMHLCPVKFSFLLSSPHLPHPLTIGPHILLVKGWPEVLITCFPFWSQVPVVPTSAVGMAGASPRAWCAISGAWTTVATAVTRISGHQPTAQVNDEYSLGPAEKLGRKVGPSCPSPGPELGRGRGRGRGMAGESKGKHSSGSCVRPSTRGLGQLGPG